jgi:transcriptional regulator with XRE-family HTH domain
VDLAKKSGVSYRRLHDIWAGRARARGTTLLRIARALGVNLAWLMHGTGPRAAPPGGAGDGAAAEAEDGAAPGMYAAGPRLPPEWPQILKDCIESEKTIVEAAVNVYDLGLEKALKPVMDKFRAALENGAQEKEDTR